MFNLLPILHNFWSEIQELKRKRTRTSTKLIKQFYFLLTRLNCKQLSFPSFSQLPFVHLCCTNEEKGSTEVGVRALFLLSPTSFANVFSILLIFLLRFASPGFHITLFLNVSPPAWIILELQFLNHVP